METCCRNVIRRRTPTLLDLIAFTTLIFYNTAYNLYIFRQASRRSWRINQTAPRVEVYMLYYENTIQEHALSLMASKLMAATAIEGNISEEGLAALSNCDDMLGELARQLVAEIKDEVDDLSASFQKMAILHPSSSKQDDIESTSTPEPVSVQASSIKQTENSVSHFVRNIEPNWDNVIFTIKPKRRQKQVPQNFEETGQVDIMDLLAS